MSEHLESTIAVNGQRLTTLENLVYDLVEIQKGLQKTQQSIGETMGLLQQSHKEFVARYQSETEPKVNVLWDNRSQIKGGYIVIAALAGTVFGGGGIGALIYELLKTAH